MLLTPDTLCRKDAIAAVRTFIADGGFSPGDRLPPERELMVSLGMTLTMLRHALEALENEGSISRHVGKGTFVAASAGPGVPNRLQDLISRISPVGMMRAHLSLEPAIAREAASHASEESVRRIRRACYLAVEAPTWDEYEAKDDALHRVIAEATGNVLLLELFDDMNQLRRAVAWNRLSYTPRFRHVTILALPSTTASRMPSRRANLPMLTPRCERI